jgi:hypothetical protein
MEQSGMTMRPPGLVDVLDRILDKGLVVAGDIKVSLANVELLTLQIRLLVCSIDKAEQIGLNWWRSDPNLSAGAGRQVDIESLEEKIQALEGELERLKVPAVTESSRSPKKRSGKKTASRRN